MAPTGRNNPTSQNLVSFPANFVDNTRNSRFIINSAYVKEMKETAISFLRQSSLTLCRPQRSMLQPRSARIYADFLTAEDAEDTVSFEFEIIVARASSP